MSLISTDEFYVQRRDERTKEYKKSRVSAETLENYILGGYQDGVTDLGNELQQEILDREAGDKELVDQMDGLTDRIRVISNELYDTLVQHEYTFKIDQLSKTNYDLLVNDNCGGLAGDDLAECKDNQLETYHQSVAGNTTSDSRGSVYLVTGNYRYDSVSSIFLSQESKNGTTIDLEQATVGSLIEVINIKQSVGGEDIIDNFNYGFYKITKLGGSFAEAYDSTTLLYRFDVDYVGSSSTNPQPSNQDDGNRFLVKLVLDLVSTLNDEYVEVIGDSMTGALNIDVVDDVNGEVLDTDGLKTSNNITGASLKLTGYNNTLENNPTTIDITNTKETTVKFATEEQVYFDFSSDWMIRDNVTVQPEDPDDDPSTTSSVVLNFTQRTDATNPSYIKVGPEVVFISKAEYLHSPNLINGTEAGNLNILPPRSYVDYQDGLLSNKIEDVSQRIDTLANASDIYAYRMLLPADSASCSTQLENGLNTNVDPNELYPRPEPGAPYNQSDLLCGRVWAECSRNTIDSVLEPNEGEAVRRGDFEWRPFIDNDYRDPITGVVTPRNIDVFIVSKYTNLIDALETPVDITWEEQVKVGDYWEISASDAITATYAIYRVTRTEVADSGTLTLEGAPLYKSNEPVQVGQNYKIKVYDKQEGLDPEDMFDLFVAKVGDVMSGPLAIAADDAEARKLFEVKSKTGTEIFDVTNEGHVGARTLRLHNQTAEILEIDENSRVSMHPTDNIARFINKTGTQFSFDSEILGPLVHIFQEEVNFRDKRLTGVQSPTSDNEAVNLGYLTGLDGGGGLLSSSDNSLSFITIGEGKNRIDAKVDQLPIGRLSDVYMEGTNRPDGSTLLWNSENNRFELSETKIEAFFPGNQVAYTGNDIDRYVELGGFYLNRSNGTLQIRVQ